jgi:excisionase family DNA binding protein
MPDEPMMTPEDVADWLQVHRHTVYRWIEEGRLPALRIGRVYRIPRAEVLAMVKRQGGAEDSDEDPDN